MCTFARAANSSGHGPVAVDTEDAENEDHMAADTYQSLRWKVGQENNLHQLASSNHECLYVCVNISIPAAVSAYFTVLL